MPREVIFSSGKILLIIVSHLYHEPLLKTSLTLHYACLLMAAESDSTFSTLHLIGQAI